MAFKMFKNLRHFMTVRHICSWQHHFTSKKIMGTEETAHGVGFLYGKLVIWAKIYPCLIADSIVSKLDQRDTKASDG